MAFEFDIKSFDRIHMQLFLNGDRVKDLMQQQGKNKTASLFSKELLRLGAPVLLLNAPAAAASTQTDKRGAKKK